MSLNLKSSLLLITLFGFCFGLTACSTSHYLNANIGYTKVNLYPLGNGTINAIRLQALRESATTLGAQGALAWRSARINKTIAKETVQLDHLFNFNQLLLPHNVLPPILVESDGNLTLADNSTIRAADKTYKIIADARFVTVSPTWRDYLWMSYTKPEVPDRSLLPTTRYEASVWNEFISEGWAEGIRQADDIFSANLNRLKRDYLGMILYRKLLSQNMITSPQVSKAELGVTGDTNELRIGDEVMRITAHSVLRADSKQWRPVIIPAPATPPPIPAPQ